MISPRKILSIFTLVSLLISCKKNQDIPPDTIQPNVPFPAHTDYSGIHIKPGNYSQSDLDAQTSAFYSEWKDEYFKTDCKAGEFYIYSGNDANTISEAHGYGMMIMCFMAGYEIRAKAYFDGLFNYYKSHPSNINNHLMDWQQLSCSDEPAEEDDAASDGDIDIAFSLLLAHKQWGSDGNINYLSEAKAMINAIMQDEINSETKSVKLGDWCKPGDQKYYYGTRSSDFITSHFRAFSGATGNSDWNLVIDECYYLINTIQNSYCTTTGLLPDFIINVQTAPLPAGANYLEDAYDGDYYYNACRFPWRIGTDYLISGDSRAETCLNKINSWLINSTSGNVQNISNGYKLSGTPIFDWNDATFIGPFAVCAMSDVSNQNWLDKLYEELLSNNDLADGDYYSNTLKLLSMITISGNYLNPEI
jgi:endoglucanase